MTDTPRANAVFGLLLSDSVNAQYGPRLDALAHSAGVRLRRHPLSQAGQALPDLHAAFFSRELYAGNSLRQPGPLSNALEQMNSPVLTCGFQAA